VNSGTVFRACLLGCCALLLVAKVVRAQGTEPAPGTGKLSKVSILGSQRFPEETVVAALNLSLGQQMDHLQMQAAADRLSTFGVFRNVRFNYRSNKEKVELVFLVEDADLVPVFFDNFPWFTDAELNAAIQSATPLYAGLLPPAGAVAERATEAIQKLLPERKISGTVTRELVGRIEGAGMMMRFVLEGPSLKIGQIQFPDPIAAADPGVKALAQDLIGKTYSRFAIELFVREHVRPLYEARGHLRADYQRPLARFTGDPNKPLPDTILVIIPIVPGGIYRWGGVTWQGNAAFADLALNAFVQFPSSEPVNGLRIEHLWETIKTEYGRLGYIDTTLVPQPTYDEAQKRVTFSVQVNEGAVFRMGELVITGLSPLAKRKIQQAWTLPAGAVFNETYFLEFLAACESKKVFEDYVVHYDEVGHLLDRKPETRTVNVLIDFK